VSKAAFFAYTAIGRILPDNLKGGGRMKDTNFGGQPEVTDFGESGVVEAGLGVGLRAAAIIIDIIVFMPVLYIIALLFGTATIHSFSLEGPGLYFAALVGFLYYVLFETRVGATIGKIVVGLRVVKNDGSPCDLNAAIIRTVLRIIDGLFFYLFGAIAVWCSRKKQRLGDKLAGTLVVRGDTEWGKLKNIFKKG
jgi:uncharacterized RDD family membrane protein YckC